MTRSRTLHEPPRYLAVSTVVAVEGCEYPDFGKVLVAAGQRGDRGLRAVFRRRDAADDYDGEPT